MENLEQGVGNLLRGKGLTLGVIESASGGLISGKITRVPGSSDYFKGSLTAYRNEVKIRVVGVKEESIQKHGAVSHEVVREMAEGGRRLLDVDICISDTGIAGPGGGTPEKKVGLFYVGLSQKGGTFSREYHFRGSRERNRRQAVQAALSWLKEYLLGLE